MTQDEIEELRSYTDKIVRLIATDGETLVVKILMLDDEYQDFIYDLISSDRENPSQTHPQNAAFVAPFSEIASFELLPEGH